jgi:hypothetical protein
VGKRGRDEEHPGHEHEQACGNNARGRARVGHGMERYDTVVPAVRRNDRRAIAIAPVARQAPA